MVFKSHSGRKKGRGGRTIPIFSRKQGHKSCKLLEGHAAGERPQQRAKELKLVDSNQAVVARIGLQLKSLFPRMNSILASRNDTCPHSNVGDQ